MSVYDYATGKLVPEGMAGWTISEPIVIKSEAQALQERIEDTLRMEPYGIGPLTQENPDLLSLDKLWQAPYQTITPPTESSGGIFDGLTGAINDVAKGTMAGLQGMALFAIAVLVLTRRD